MTDRVDPAAFRAAYNALMPYLPHAQVRGEVAEQVTRTVVDCRTRQGLGHIATLAQSEQARQPVVADVKAVLPEAWTAAHPAFIDRAVRAAAKALWDGTEHVAVITHDDHGRLTPASTVTVAGRSAPIPHPPAPFNRPGDWAARVNAALAELGYRMADGWGQTIAQTFDRSQVEIVRLDPKEQ